MRTIQHWVSSKQATKKALTFRLAESLKPDPFLSERQHEIRNQLKAIDAKLRDINKNSSEVEEKIYKALQIALFQLQGRFLLSFVSSFH